jgi:beta-glucosidase
MAPWNRRRKTFRGRKGVLCSDCKDSRCPAVEKLRCRRNRYWEIPPLQELRLKSSFLFAALLTTAVAAAHAQAPHPLTSADHQQIESIIKRMSVQQKLDYIGGTGFAVRALPELGLPAFEMSDGPYGVRSNSGAPSTTYAAGIGLAATWDRTLAAEVGAGIGRDARARGVHYMLGPGTNIYRSPRNGRNFEYFGEDPYLASQMVVGYITGMQKQGVSSTVKHFLANNSEYLRHDSDSIVDERTLREIYLPAFEAAVKQANTGAIMDSYNLINGLHATQNGYFNTEIVRKEWGFKGTMMSDWDATYSAVGAANGGLDIEMPTGKFMNSANLMPALQSGMVTQATIDEKIRHILTTAAMFGWLAPGAMQRDESISVMSHASNATALKSAREAPVLLKNEGGVLPLSKSLKTILLVGPAAYPGAAVGGGSAGVAPFHQISLLEGLGSVAPNVNILYSAGLPTLSQLAERTTFTTADSGGEVGLLHETFANKDLTGAATKEPNSPHIDNAGLGWDAISGNLEELMALFMKPPTSTSQRYTGYFNAGTATSYLVALAGAGEGNGDRVYLDDKLIIDDWTMVRAFEPHLTMPLTAGMHKVVVESWQSGPIGGKLRFAIVPEDSVVDPQAKAMAAKADAVVVAVGFTTNRDANTESEGGDRTFDLPYGQDALILAMATANPKTIVTVTSGGNVDSTTWIDRVPALMEGWYGGQAGGQGMAEILMGDVNPGGHLPATFERRAEDNPAYAFYYPEPGTNRVLYKEGIFVGYRGYERNHTVPLFPFGYGLSYTTFRFANLKLKEGTGTTLATVDFDVTNTGSRKGSDVAQVYVTDPHAPVPRPMHELKGFERVELNPGQTTHVSVMLDPRAFAYYDVNAKHWTIDAGKFRIAVGDSIASLPLSGELNLNRSAVSEAENDSSMK